VEVPPPWAAAEPPICWILPRAPVKKWVWKLVLDPLLHAGLYGCISTGGCSLLCVVYISYLARLRMAWLLHGAPPPHARPAAGPTLGCRYC
jgi:hypothetical protein